MTKPSLSDVLGCDLDSEGYDDSLIAMLLTPIQRGKHMQIVGNGRIQIRLRSWAKDGLDINDEWKAVAGEAYMHRMTGMVHSYRQCPLCAHAI
jgi:hypothetical protein